MARSTRQEPTTSDLELADRLHSAAVHLLRRLRTEDAASGLTAPRLSALSVVVFAGPIGIGELAAAEQVRPPTISRLVKDLEREGLVERVTDRHDRRRRRIRATSKGKRLLREGRHRRVATLARDLASLSSGDRRALTRAADLLEGIALPPEHPVHE